MEVLFVSPTEKCFINLSCANTWGLSSGTEHIFTWLFSCHAFTQCVRFTLLHLLKDVLFHMCTMIYLNVFASTTLLWLSPNAIQCIFFTLRCAVPLQTQIQEGMCSVMFCSGNIAQSFICVHFFFLKTNDTTLCLNLPVLSLSFLPLSTPKTHELKFLSLCLV